MTENVKEIIEKIEYFDGTFPKEELQILLDNRELTTPFLLDAIRNPERVLDKLLDEKEYFLSFYALLMLAQFREPKAYPLVYELLPEIEKSYAENKNDLGLMGVWEDFQNDITNEESRFLNGSDENFDFDGNGYLF